MVHRFLIAALLLAAAACRDAPTAVNGPSPPTPQSSGVTRATLLGDSLTLLIEKQLARHPAAGRDQVGLADPAAPDSSDVVILQATLDLIDQVADSLAADTAFAGQ
jgi:hypothetical protein